MTDQQYAPPPPGAAPMDGPDDAEEAAWKAAREHADYVRRELATLRARHAARTIFDLEQRDGEQIPGFDAGMLGEVLARPPLPAHRAEGLIPADAGTLVVAQRKTGKTTLLLNLARCLVDGADFLGQFPVTPVTGRVAFLNFEVSGQQLARWAADVNVDPNRLFLVNLRGRRNPLAHPADLDALAAKLRGLNVESIVVDPFGRAYHGTSQNDAGEVGTWLANLDRFARGDVGARDIILAAHAGWSGERSRGSTALEDWADSIVTLTQDDGRVRYLRAEGRDVLVSEDQLDFDDRTRTLTLAGTGSRKTAARTRQVDALIPTVAQILAETPSLSGNAIDKAIKALIDAGDIDLPHSKGDGTKAAQILERRGMVASKAGARGARLFTLITSPTSLNLPQGSQSTSPTSPIGREVDPGNSDPTSPAREDTDDPGAP